MSRLDDQDLDFGHVLESFERESEVHQGTPRPRGKLIRQEPEADAAKPRAYQKPTEEEDFASALAAFDAEQGSAKERTPQVGQAVEGTLLSLDLESALVDFGSKAEGVVATDELVDEDGILLFKVGDTTRFEIAGREPGGTYRLRRAGSGSGQHPLEVGQVVQGVVTAINKGGAEVQVGSKARCFCPFSQLADRRVEDAEQFVGRRLRFEVTKVERTSAVLSRRALLEKEKQERADRLREQLHVGAVVSGRVTAIEDYGVFVDLGGLEGLVHVSELAFERLAHPSERVEMGQELDVQITRLERRSDGRDRISLSRKALDRDPWIDAHQEFQEGVTREGEVQRLESFGAFVQLKPGVEGLVHISELGQGRRLNHPREVLQVGQKIPVRVLSLDPVKKRISLAPVHDAELASSEPAMRQLLDQHRTGEQGLGSLAAAFAKKRKL